MKEKRKFTLQYQQQEFDGSVIPESVIQRYKADGDENPEFRVYCISQEGDCTGKIVGKGAIATRYARNIISKLNETVKSGVKAFLGHNKDNTHDGRTDVGEIVRSFVEDVGGKLTQFAAVYIKPAFRNLKLDVASIETDVECEYDGQGTFNVLDVDPITGLALGDSSQFSPGFKDATLRAQLQYFLDDKKERPMDLAEIMAEIKKGGHKPSDVFTKRELESDDLVDTIRKAHSQKEYDHRIKVEEKLTDASKKLEEVEKELGTFKEANKQLSTKISKTLVKELSESLIKENKYDDKQKKFIEKQLESFDPGEFKDEKSLKSVLGEKMTKFSEDYKEFAKLMGVKIEDNKPPIGGDDSIETVSGDYTDPAVNDFIGV